MRLIKTIIPLLATLVLAGCGNSSNGKDDYQTSSWTEINDCSSETRDYIGAMKRAVDNYSDEIVAKMEELVPEEKRVVEPLEIVDALTKGGVSIYCGVPVEGNDVAAAWLAYSNDIVINENLIGGFRASYEANKKYVDSNFEVDYDFVKDEIDREGFEKVESGLSELFHSGTSLAGILLHETAHYVFYKHGLNPSHAKPSDEMTSDDIANDVICQYGYGFQAFWDFYENEVFRELENRFFFWKNRFLLKKKLCW
jgi:hypothetical protein